MPTYYTYPIRDDILLWGNFLLYFPHRNNIVINIKKGKESMSEKKVKETETILNVNDIMESKSAEDIEKPYITDDEAEKMKIDIDRNPKTILFSFDRLCDIAIPYAISWLTFSAGSISDTAISMFGQPYMAIPNIISKVNPFKIATELTVEIVNDESEDEETKNDIVLKRIKQLMFLHKIQSERINMIVEDPKYNEVINSTYIIYLQSKKYNLTNVKIYEYYDQSVVLSTYEYLKNMIDNAKNIDKTFDLELSLYTKKFDYGKEEENE